MDIKVSIIIPIYNVEQYIAQCAHSLFKQTYQNIEFIFVDDASPDSSIFILEKIIAEYNNRKGQIILVRKKTNEGLPQARKTGFEKSTGDYIICADSDDWLELNMIEKMANKAISEDLDIVWCNYFKDDAHIIKDCPRTNDKVEIFKGLFNGDFTGSLCNKLVKREVYSNEIYFPYAMLLEDFVVSIQNIYHAKKIAFLNAALYHYRTSPNSLLQDKSKFAKGLIESCENIAWIVKFLENKFNNNLEFLEPQLSHRINYIKIDIAVTKETKDMKKLYELYPKSLSIKTFFKYKKPTTLALILVLFFAKRNILFPYKLFFLLRGAYMKRKKMVMMP
jgi:glycosyltransferase involved in cell wall biosynthesis